MKSLQLTAILLALVPQGTPYATRPATTALGQPEIAGTCASACKLVQSISGITTEEDPNGVCVRFNWTVAQLSANTKIIGYTTTVILLLKNEKTVDATQNVGANTTAANVVVSGTIPNRNINLPDVKRIAVQLKANAVFTPNPTVTVTSKEIVGDDGAEVNMRVKWTPPTQPAPCQAETFGVIAASAENAGGVKFQGTQEARLGDGSAIVRLRGLGIRRKEMKNLQAEITPKNVPLTCTAAKSASGGA